VQEAADDALGRYAGASVGVMPYGGLVLPKLQGINDIPRT
jgi:hypothetical protein